MRPFHSHHSIRLFTAVCLLSIFGQTTLLVSQPVFAEQPTLSTRDTSDHRIERPVEQMQLSVDTSRSLSMNTRIPRFEIDNEEVVAADPVSDRVIEITAQKPGTAQLKVWNTENQIQTIVITVVDETPSVAEILRTQLPRASLQVTPIRDNAIVSGYVTREQDIQRALAIVEQFHPLAINNIRVAGVTQVLLHTRVMEVNRAKLRRLGLTTPWSEPALNPAKSKLCFESPTALQSLFQALEQQQLLTVLASPTLVTTQGRPARFKIGGRIPNVLDEHGRVDIAYEAYGTSIEFNPLEVDADQIQLQVRPEVCELDPDRAVTSGSAQYPAFQTRGVETIVTLRAGQTFVLGGLSRAAVRRVLSQQPELNSSSSTSTGTLFRDAPRDTDEMEMLVTVTVELVEANDRANTSIATSTSDALDKGMIHQEHAAQPVDPRSPTARTHATASLPSNRQWR
ncbi:outer membrane porin HofQ [Allorhodopirellula solitaria]|uniref:Outer membrane porin HofQ n=2 Tax=Allorhodopirellula solitaria TaxID=2527987 RepID=A0A5C5YJE3_9BACT|nr:outer membrane porin HofQ [Allorhodopirellula solitaria]